MANRAAGDVVKSVRTLLDVGTLTGLSDSQLLERYLLRPDDASNAAFTTLVERHGPMVLRTCRSVLHDVHAAEDAFQATFLILARKAASIRQWDSIASWLFGVARRVAFRAHAQRKRRATQETDGATALHEVPAGPSQSDPIPEIQEEVDRLPERYRAPVVLCYLEGLTHAEAAIRLRMPASTVRVRLMRARTRLRDRLARRGLAPAALAGLSAGRAQAAIPAHVVDETIHAATLIAAGRGAGVSTSVAALAEGVNRAMFFAKLKLAAALLGALAVVSFWMLSSLAALTQPETPQGVAKERAPAPAPTDQTKPRGGAREVIVTTAKRGPWRRTTAVPGNVIAAQSVDLYARVSGYLSNLNVDIGSRVKAGQNLATLYDPESTVLVEKARAEGDRARARVQKAEAAVQVSQAAANAARAKVEAASIAVETAQSTAGFQRQQLDRLRIAAGRKTVSDNQVDEAENRYQSALALSKTARAERLVAEAAVLESRASITAAQSGLAEATSELRFADAGLHSADITVGYSRIDAPFDGIVTRRNYHQGDLVRSPAAGNVIPILTVVNTSVMRVEIDVAENESAYVDPGDPVKIRIRALGWGAIYEGRIARTAYALKNRGLRAEIDLLNPDGRLRPGQMGQVELELESREDVLTIPTSAIFDWLEGGAVVCFRLLDDHAVRTTISIGEPSGAWVEVLKGLTAGDVVISNPGPQMRDGEAVKIKTDPRGPDPQ